MISFLLLLVISAEINWFDPRGATIYHIWQPYYLLHLKYASTELFLMALFKRFSNLPIKIWRLNATAFLAPDWCIYIKRNDFGYIFQIYFNLLYI